MSAVLLWVINVKEHHQLPGLPIGFTLQLVSPLVLIINLNDKEFLKVSQEIYMNQCSLGSFMRIFSSVDIHF